MLSVIIIVGSQLVDIVDNCNNHNCVMGSFSFLLFPEGAKNRYLPPMHRALQKIKRLYNYDNGKSMYYHGNYPLHWLVETPLL